MSAPQFAPTPTLNDVRVYGSPDVAPQSWVNNRPTDIEGFQPVGEHLGFQGPDQGYALLLANRLSKRLHLVGGLATADAIRGCLNIAQKIFWNNETRNSFCSWRRIRSTGQHQVNVVFSHVMFAERNINLGSGDAVCAIGILDCLRAHCTNVTTRIWFGEVHGSRPFARNHFG